MMTTTTTTRLATLGVLAGAYKSRKSTLLTHTATLDADGYVDGVLCKRVELDNIADSCSASDEEQAAPPTCPQCLRRDPRHK